MPSRFSTLSALTMCAAALVACASSSGSTVVPAAQPVASATVAGLPASVTAQMIAVGDSIFHKGSCQRCHGMDAKGTDRAPNLTDSNSGPDHRHLSGDRRGHHRRRPEGEDQDGRCAVRHARPWWHQPHRRPGEAGRGVRVHDQPPLDARRTEPATCAGSALSRSRRSQCRTRTRAAQSTWAAPRRIPARRARSRAVNTAVAARPWETRPSRLA